MSKEHLEVRQRDVKPLLTDSSDAPLVLAVDDHPINRDLLARQIKLLGLRVETAENGQAALALWRDGNIAMIITDCHMPEMDGYGLSRKIRQIEAAEARPHTPIIAWSANALPEEVGLCQAAGMDELLVKPANLMQLKRMLAKWLHILNGHIADQQQDGKYPIDHEVLNMVVPDSDDQTQVLQDFYKHICADHFKLHALLKQGDRVGVETTAHRMGGSSRMVGAKDLVAACTFIESAARAGDLASAQASQKSLDQAINQLKIYLAEEHIHANR